MKFNTFFQLIIGLLALIGFCFVAESALYFYVDYKYDVAAKKYDAVNNARSCNGLNADFSFFSHHTLKKGEFSHFRFEYYDYDHIDLYFILHKKYMSIALLCDSDNRLVEIIPVYE